MQYFSTISIKHDFSLLKLISNSIPQSIHPFSQLSIVIFSSTFMPVLNIYPYFMTHELRSLMSSEFEIPYFIACLYVTQP